MRDRKPKFFYVSLASLYNSNETPREISKNNLIALLFILIAWFTPWTQAQVPPQNSLRAGAGSRLDFSRNPAVIDLKLKLEQVITKTYRERLETQIDPDLFQISAQVVLGPAADSSGESPGLGGGRLTGSISTGELPADTTLGLVMDEQNTMNQQSLLTPSLSPSGALSELLSIAKLMDKTQIDKVSLFIGIDDSVSDSLKSKITEWINRSLKEDFKDRGFVEIGFFPKVQSIYSIASKYQFLIGLFLLMLVLLFLGIIIRFTISKDTIARNENAMKIQALKGQQLANNAKNPTPLPESTPKPSQVSKDSSSSNPDPTDPSTGFQLLLDLQKKIGFFIELNQMAPEILMESWGTQGWAGRLKIAGVIDALLAYDSLGSTTDPKSQAGRAVNQFRGRSQEYIRWLSDRKEVSGREQYEAFQQFSEISLLDRRQILEQCYWDILSIAAMGQRILKTRFGALQTMSNDQIASILQQQDANFRNLAVLHMSPEKISAFISGLNLDQKKVMFEDCLSMDQVSLSEVEIADEKLTQLANQKEGLGNSESMSVKPLVLNLIPSLTVTEEFAILPKAFSKSGDGGLALKKSYPSLVFIKEWPEDMQRIFFEQLESVFILSYLQMEPGMADTVLKMLPPKTATILKDELQSGVKFSETELIKNLTYLKERLGMLVQEDRINLEKSFPAQVSKVA